MAKQEILLYLLKISQGSNLGVVFFNNVFINGLDAEIECILSKFPDATKIGVAVNSCEDREALHRGPDRLETWAITSCMEFNKRECWVLCQGWGNAGHPYALGDARWRAALWKEFWGSE